MTALPAPTRTRLAKLLDDLGADDVDRCVAAARAAHELVTQHRITGRHVLRPQPVAKHLPLMGTWRQTCAECLARSESLRAWEVTFLRDLLGFTRLSRQQRYMLAEISDRVLKREAP